MCNLGQLVASSPDRARQLRTTRGSYLDARALSNGLSTPSTRRFLIRLDRSSRLRDLIFGRPAGEPLPPAMRGNRHKYYSGTPMSELTM